MYWRRFTLGQVSKLADSGQMLSKICMEFNVTVLWGDDKCGKVSRIQEG